ncbi:MAG: iron ABC transporter permease, partial [Spirochaetaceae bacterium]|nr:iron ABC transporter permease [Spirochaetaceae bacterium]
MQFVFSLRLWNVILFTVIQACVSTFIAVAVGMPAGWLTAKRRFLGKSMFSVITAVPFCVPPLLIALGVVMYYGMNGVINKLAAQFSLPAFTGLYSFGG